MQRSINNSTVHTYSTLYITTERVRICEGAPLPAVEYAGKRIVEYMYLLITSSLLGITSVQ